MLLFNLRNFHTTTHDDEKRDVRVAKGKEKNKKKIHRHSSDVMSINFVDGIVL